MNAARPLQSRTLYDKLWDDHVVHVEDDGTTVLYIDRHLVHEVTSPQAYEGLRLAGRAPWRVSSIVATADHNTPTTGWEQGYAGIDDPISKEQIVTLDSNIRSFGAAAYFPFLDKRQGIVHVMGPEQGATLPGHDRGVRRFAYQHARRVRCARIRHRHQRSRARAGHADAVDQESRQHADQE